jgi:hypothetical protein
VGWAWELGWGDLSDWDFSVTDHASIRNLGRAQYTLFYSGSEWRHLTGGIEVALVVSGGTMLTQSDSFVRKFFSLGFLGLSLAVVAWGRGLALLLWRCRPFILGRVSAHRRFTLKWVAWVVL